jgi:hypothetical protein
MERPMARSGDARTLKRMVEDLDDALEFNLPFIATAEGDAWRQVHELLQLIGHFADEAHAPEMVWREAEAALQELHEALLAAVSRGRSRARQAPDPMQPSS